MTPSPFSRLLATGSIGAFQAPTGVPILINPGFNVSGRPIMRTAAEAWECSRHLDIDLLVLGDQV